MMLKTHISEKIVYFCAVTITEAMELQTVNIEKENIIPSGASIDGMSVRRSGIAKVLWRKLDIQVPKSEIIKDGVNLYNN
jgi:hypothetical protein